MYELMAGKKMLCREARVFDQSAGGLEGHDGVCQGRKIKKN